MGGLSGTSKEDTTVSGKLDRFSFLDCGGELDELDERIRVSKGRNIIVSFDLLIDFLLSPSQCHLVISEFMWYLLPTVFVVYKQVEGINLNIYMWTLDKYGHTRSELGYEISATRELFEKVDWDNINVTHLRKLLLDEGRWEEHNDSLQRLKNEPNSEKIREGRGLNVRN